MTKKVKNGLIISGASIASVALAMLIATQFKKPETVNVYNPESSSSSSVIVDELEATNSASDGDTDSGLVINPTISSNTSDNTDKVEPPDDTGSTDNTDGTNGITVVQDFTDTTGTKDTTPPEKPVIKDKTQLTDSTKVPEYDEEQTEIKPKPPVTTNTNDGSDTPHNGDKKDGKVYIKGFGWIADKGGGGEGTYAEDMYENGNKIGYFG